MKKMRHFFITVNLEGKSEMIKRKIYGLIQTWLKQKETQHLKKEKRQEIKMKSKENIEFFFIENQINSGNSINVNENLKQNIWKYCIQTQFHWNTKC